MTKKELIECCCFDTGSGSIKFTVDRCTDNKYLIGFPEFNIEVDNFGHKLNHIQFVVSPKDLISLGEMLIRISENSFEEIIGGYPYIERNARTKSR